MTTSIPLRALRLFSGKDYFSKSFLICQHLFLSFFKLFFIQFGHNDEKREDPTRYTEPYGSFKENLKVFIEVARKHGAYPVLITPLERRCFGEKEVLGAGAHGDYVSGMKGTAVEENVPLVDLYTMSRELMNEAGKAETEDWFMNIKPDTYINYKAGQVDNTHLKYTGAVRFAGLIARGLKGLGGIYAELLVEYDF